MYILYAPYILKYTRMSELTYLTIPLYYVPRDNRASRVQLIPGLQCAFICVCMKNTT